MASPLITYHPSGRWLASVEDIHGNDYEAFGSDIAAALAELVDLVTGGSDG